KGEDLANGGIDSQLRFRPKSPDAPPIRTPLLPHGREKGLGDEGSTRVHRRRSVLHHLRPASLRHQSPLKREDLPNGGIDSQLRFRPKSPDAAPIRTPLLPHGREKGLGDEGSTRGHSRRSGLHHFHPAPLRPRKRRNGLFRDLTPM